ncbi:MAG: hypothetical protein U1F26_10230 [Lysobacterales bacterium]
MNGATALPFDAGDANCVEADPLRPAPTSVQTPHWQPGSDQCNGRYASIHAVVVAVVDVNLSANGFE